MAPRHASALDALLLDEGFDGEIRMNEPLARHTTYRIGGPAYAYVEVRSVAALGAVLKACAEDGLPWYPVGKGSNLLVADEGFPGVVICLAGGFRQVNFVDEVLHVVVGAGTMLSRLVQEVFHHGWGGMEFAVGTPGTVGGALMQNAGTRSDWIGSRVVSVTAYHAELGLRRYAASDLQWGYRTSSFSPDEVIVECELKLECAVSAGVHERMSALLQRRRASQPLGLPTCGSVFMNPEGTSVGQLIENAGLKGVRCGGAQVSEKHANFIVNTGGATANDVLSLIRRIQDEVRGRYGIELQPEVKFLGFTE